MPAGGRNCGSNFQQAAGDRQYKYVFLSQSHRGIPDVEILDKLLQPGVILLTGDCVLHMRALEAGCRSYTWYNEQGQLTRGRLPHVQTKKSLPLKLDAGNIVTERVLELVLGSHATIQILVPLFHHAHDQMPDAEYDTRANSLPRSLSWDPLSQARPCVRWNAQATVLEMASETPDGEPIPPNRSPEHPSKKPPIQGIELQLSTAGG